MSVEIKIMVRGAIPSSEVIMIKSNRIELSQAFVHLELLKSKILLEIAKLSRIENEGGN